MANIDLDTLIKILESQGIQNPDNLAAMGVLPEQRSLLDQQMKLAQQLRGTPMPQGREVGNGRVFVASSPLENVATAMQRFQGGQNAASIQGQQQGLIDQERGNRASVLRSQMLSHQRMIDALKQIAQNQKNKATPPTAPSPETPASAWGWQAE